MTAHLFIDQELFVVFPIRSYAPLYVRCKFFVITYKRLGILLWDFVIVFILNLFCLKS